MREYLSHRALVSLKLKKLNMVEVNFLQKKKSAQLNTKGDHHFKNFYFYTFFANLH